MRSQELQIVTPEAVIVRLPTAGLGSRFIARGLDVLIQGVAIFVLLMVVGLTGGALSGAIGGGTAGTIAFVIVLIAITLIWLGYPIAFETLWRGRTPGKAALGLRVVTREGAPIRFRHALVRGVLGLVDVWLVGGSVGVLTILVSRHEQRFGDMAAGTIVVRERSGAPAPAATVFAPPPGWEGYVASLDLSGVSPADYEVVRSFLLRARGIGPAARADLAARLATPIIGGLGHTPPPGMGPELWLACLAAAYQRRHGGSWYPGYPVYPSPGYWYGAGQDYPAPQAYGPGQAYGPPAGYAPAPGYAGAPGQGYAGAPGQEYGPIGGYNSAPGYRPTGGYGPAEGYEAAGYGRAQAYDPAAGYGLPPGPAPGYSPTDEDGAAGGDRPPSGSIPDSDVDPAAPAGGFSPPS